MDDMNLGRARSGDGTAFERLVAPHRRELLVHCYRSLGSMHDAEDVMQEVLVSAWGALNRFDGRSLRAWLYRIATNRCINHRRDASRRPQPARPPASNGAAAGISAADDPWWLEPYPEMLLEDRALGPEARFDARESIALSFVAGLQHLPAKQRAVLVLRDVLGFTAAETADILDTTRPSVNSALIRARGGFRPDRSPDTVPAPRSAEEAAVVGRFVDAFQQCDLSGVVDILTDDVRLSMPPEPIQCTGPTAVANYLRARGFWGPQLSLVPTRANGQPALGYYLPTPDNATARLNGLIVLTINNDRVSALTRFGNDIVQRFGLSETGPSRRSVDLMGQ
jgi:RNA polymerase sigma-70 factor (TIGR02960 family)